MSSTSSNYDLTRLNLGLYTGGFAALLSVPATYKLLSKFRHSGIFLMFSVLGYGGMMFASSYVEEEQQFWYWLFTGWVFYLHIRLLGKQYLTSLSPPSATSGGYRSFAVSVARASSPVWLSICCRILRRWNQTGQKFTGEPDIARAYFSTRQNALWSLVILTYADTCRHLFLSMPAVVVWRLTAVTVTVAAFVFKLSFVASDSPELLSTSFLGPIANSGVSLVSQARLVFGGIALLMILPVCISKIMSKSPGKQSGKC